MLLAWVSRSESGGRMPEYMCGLCGWRATSPYIEGMLAASRHHEKTGCEKKEEKDERADADQG